MNRSPAPKSTQISNFSKKCNTNTSNRPRYCNQRWCRYTDTTVTRKQYSATKHSKNSQIRWSAVLFATTPYCHSPANQRWPFLGHLSQAIDLAASVGINLGRLRNPVAHVDHSSVVVKYSRKAKKAAVLATSAVICVARLPRKVQSVCLIVI